jgi:hypothetical protein
MQFVRPKKKKKLKVFQAKLEELVDQYEAKKHAQPHLEPSFLDVEKCLDETGKQAREISKVTALVAEHKSSIQNGRVVLTEESQTHVLFPIDHELD